MDRKISEIQADLSNAKRELKNVRRAAGDDFGVDGTREECEAIRGWIRSYQSELSEARMNRAAQRVAKLLL